MTPERKAELAQHRQNSALTDHQRMLDGILVDGNQVITQAFAKRAAIPKAALPEMVTAGKGKGGKLVGVRR